MLTHNIECTDLALAKQKEIGGTVYRLTNRQPEYMVNTPNSLYPGKGGWDYHDVLIKDRMVYDALSKYGKDTPIPFQKWWRYWEQGAATNIRGLNK